MRHSFNFDKGSIRLVATHKGKQYKRATGLTTSENLWNRDAKTLRAKCKDERIWKRLRAIDLRVEEVRDEAVTEGDVLRIMEYGITGIMPDSRSLGTRKLSFWEYFEEWANRDTPQIRQRRLCYNNIARFMGMDFGWNDVDSAFHFRLTQKMNAAGFALNYQWRTVQQLKAMMNEGLKLKYHSNEDFREFKAKKEEPDTVYLTASEVERLWAYEPKGSMNAKARDLFLLGVWSCARFSDYSRLSLDNIVDGVIRFTQKKTSGSVMVPASPRLVEILERNGGKAPSLSQQKFNEAIKVVCRDCGIDTPVEVTTSNGGVHRTTTVPKWTQVSSHCSRRTALTLLYLTGVPLQQVMLISGHKRESSILRYLRLTKEENVEKLRDNPFFG